MGVYIPNIKKPKECVKCPYIEMHKSFIYADGKSAFTNGCMVSGKDIAHIHGTPTDCPLIEIDLVRCGECKWWVKDGNDSFGYAMFCEHDCSLGGQGIKKPTDFCSYGERRTDE